MGVSVQPGGGKERTEQGLQSDSYEQLIMLHRNHGQKAVRTNRR